MLKLEYITGKQGCIWLVQEQMLIGSDNSNDIVIDEGGVAPFHAKLCVDGHLVEISNLDNEQGSFVNGQLIDQNYQLRSGDVIQLAQTQLKVVDPLEADQETEPHWTNPDQKDDQVLEQEQNTAINEDKTVIRAPESKWILKVDNGPLMGQIVIVDKSLRIGRDHSCDIVIPGEHISRHHAEISVEEEQLFVSDLGSANGSFINNRQIKGKSKLKNQDVLRLDVIKFKVLHRVEDFSHGHITNAEEFAESIDLEGAAEAEQDVLQKTFFEGPWLINLSNTSEMIPLSKERITVGRWENCHGNISNESVSSRHAELVCSDGNWSIGDLASSNGTFVNGKKVSSAKLKLGDKIRFGSAEYLLSAESSINPHSANSQTRLSNTSQIRWLKAIITLIVLGVILYAAKDWINEQFFEQKKNANYAYQVHNRGPNHEC